MIQNKIAIRQATILIIIAGLSALLASLALAFFVKINSGNENVDQVTKEAQARIMLHAACAFIMESSRMGYDYQGSPPQTHQFLQPTSNVWPTISGHREAYGWADIRDGSIGPKDQSNQIFYNPTTNQWPAIDPNPKLGAGGVIICPMYCWARPPYAIQKKIIYNEFKTSLTNLGDPGWGLPLLENPDPLPVINNGWTSSSVSPPGSLNASIANVNWNSFRTGDPTPVQNSLGKSWFRVHRVGVTTFVVTCGSGGSMGFKNWDEVISGIGGRPIPGSPLYALSPTSPNHSALFGGSQSMFESLQASEFRCWYEVQWSAAIKTPTRANLLPYPYTLGEYYPDVFDSSWWWNKILPNNQTEIYPLVSPTGISFTSGSSLDGGTIPRQGTNHVGTISYIQRLREEPLGQVQPGMNQVYTW